MCQWQRLRDSFFLCSRGVEGSIKFATLLVYIAQTDVLMQDFQDQKMVLQLYQLFIAMATIITHVATMLGMLPYKYRERSPITMAITQKEWVVVMVSTKHLVNYMSKYNAILISHVSG